MLEIKDINKFKIYRYKYWALYFKYNENYYLLHLSEEDYEPVTTLYFKTIDTNGNYALSPIKSEYGRYIPSMFTNGKTYKEQKERIIKYLTFYNFVKSEFSKEVKKDKIKILKIENKMKDLQEKRRQIKSKYY